MRLKKNLLAVLLLVLVLFDGVIVYRLVDQGLPKYVKVSSEDVVQVLRVPFTWEDCLIVISLVVLHIVIIYLFRRFRRFSRSAQVQH
jgi:hypothetical protein